jgi:hypothetical protein
LSSKGKGGGKEKIRESVLVQQARGKNVLRGYRKIRIHQRECDFVFFSLGRWKEEQNQYVNRAAKLNQLDTQQWIS